MSGASRQWRTLVRYAAPCSCIECQHRDSTSAYNTSGCSPWTCSDLVRRRRVPRSATTPCLAAGPHAGDSQRQGRGMPVNTPSYSQEADEGDQACATSTVSLPSRMALWCLCINELAPSGALQELPTQQATGTSGGAWCPLGYHSMDQLGGLPAGIGGAQQSTCARSWISRAGRSSSAIQESPRRPVSPRPSTSRRSSTGSGNRPVPPPPPKLQPWIPSEHAQASSSNSVPPHLPTPPVVPQIPSEQPPAPPVVPQFGAYVDHALGAYVDAPGPAMVLPSTQMPSPKHAVAAVDSPVVVASTQQLWNNGPSGTQPRPTSAPSQSSRAPQVHLHIYPAQ